jgi:hypothetical protein
VKTATDSEARLVNLVPQVTTLSYLTSLASPSNKPTSSRVQPTETTLFELVNVTLTEAKLESDNDYHLVLTDGTQTMIAEVPDPSACASASPLYCNMTHARSVADALGLSSSFRTVNQPVTVMGIGFFDYAHGQTGVAPNAIELHPVLAFCMGRGCDPRAP